MSDSLNLPRSRPSERGVDARSVLAFLDAVERDDAVELHSLLVLKQGAVVAEGYAAPYEAADAPLVYSVSKTFTASAIALALGEGLVALEDRVVDLLAKDAPDAVDPRVAELTLHHVLSMSTGHVEDTLDCVRRSPEEQWARAWLSLPPAEPVGSRHAYDNGASWLLGEIVRTASGESLTDYLRPRLLDPIGVEIASWTTDRLGREQGFSGVHVTTEGIVRLAELLRCDGVWRGRRLLPEGWVARASTAQIPTARPGEEVEPDWALGYGYQVWRSTHGFRLDGAKGQFGLVLPEHEAVIALTSAQSPAQPLLQHVWEHLVPGLVAADPDSGAEEELADRLAHLEVPGPRRRLSEEQTPPPVDAITVRRAGSGWSVGLTSGDETVALEHDGSGPTWQRHRLHLDAGVVTVASAVVERDDTAEVALVFLSTPHVLEASVSLSSSTVDRVGWREAPLWSSRLAHFAS